MRSLKYRRIRFGLILLGVVGASLFILINQIDKNSRETAAEIEVIACIADPISVNTINIDYKEEIVEEEIIEEPVIRYRQRNLPSRGGSFKTYMGHKSITNKRSMQYELQQSAYTDELGFRKINDKYLVAMGTHYSASCGKEFKITLDSGTEFEVIIGDIKQDIHTDKNNQFVEANGNIIEFIVDMDKLDKLAKKLGSVSVLGLEGNIIKIEERIDND